MAHGNKDKIKIKKDPKLYNFNIKTSGKNLENKRVVVRKEEKFAGKWITYYTLYQKKVNDDKDEKELPGWEMIERKGKSESNSVDATEMITIIKSKENNSNKICLILNYRPPVGKACLEFPAGLVDKGEKLRDSAIRELEEETGITPTFVSKESSPLLYSDPWKSTEDFVMFYAEVDEDDKNNFHQQDLDSEELIEVVFFPLDNLLKTITEFAEKRDVGIDAKIYTFCMGLQLGKSLSNPFVN